MQRIDTINNFWSKQAKNILWNKFPKKILKYDTINNKHKWFRDGYLNACYNVIDKNIINGLGKKIAITYLEENGEFKEYTYNELLTIVSSLCTILKKKLHPRKKNLIMIHGSTSIEINASMLAASRLGIHHCVVFRELSFEAIVQRIQLFKPSIIITKDNDEKINKIFKYLKKNKNFLQTKILILSKKNYNSKNKFKINFDNLKKSIKNNKIEKCNFKKSTSSFFTLFTSGSTGKPKGIVHSLGGYLTYNYFTCKKNFGLEKNSVMLTASDAGWLNGHSYGIYGPLLFGSKLILIKNNQSLLDLEILKHTLVSNKVTILYLPVTLIRMMRSINKNLLIKSKYLKTLGSMGEPLAEPVGNWFAKSFGLKNKSIVNAYYQTENGSIISSPTFKDLVSKYKHGTIGTPHKILGVKLVNVSKNKKIIKKEIIISNPWPGCMKQVLNGNEVWREYWDQNGNFKLFDLATKKGNSLTIDGRIDDVINIRGHRIGSAEFESIILINKNIIETCAVNVKDDLQGSVFILFCVIKKNDLNIRHNIIKNVIKYFGSYAIPTKVYFVKQLPKTRSGKILRRLMRDIYINPNLYNYGDLSTIINPDSVDEIRKKIKYNI